MKEFLRCFLRLTFLVKIRLSLILPCLFMELKLSLNALFDYSLLFKSFSLLLSSIIKSHLIFNSTLVFPLDF